MKVATIQFPVTLDVRSNFDHLLDAIDRLDPETLAVAPEGERLVKSVNIGPAVLLKRVHQTRVGDSFIPKAVERGRYSVKMLKIGTVSCLFGPTLDCRECGVWRPDRSGLGFGLGGRGRAGSDSGDAALDVRDEGASLHPSLIFIAGSERLRFSRLSPSLLHVLRYLDAHLKNAISTVEEGHQSPHRLVAPFSSKTGMRGITPGG